MRRKNIMLARKFDAKRLAKWPKPYIIQPKINGRRALANFGPLGQCVLYSSEDNPIVSLPTLINALNKWNLKNITLDGELYVHGWTKQQIDRVVGRTNTIHTREVEMQYHVFDFVDKHISQNNRTRILYNMQFPAGSNIIPIDGIRRTDIDEALDYWLKEGYEGIIIRHLDGLYQPCNEKPSRADYMMKLKPRQTLFAKVIGTLEERSIYNELKGTLGAFKCQLPNGQTFKVGTGFTCTQREDYIGIESGQIIEIYYQELSERGVPVFPVFKRLVFEKLVENRLVEKEEVI